jgi:MFS family permease
MTRPAHIIDSATRNVPVYIVTEILASLIFHVPVWVAFELQYISLGQLAVIEAIMQGAQLLSELPTGAIADLLGKKISVIIGRGIGIVGLVLYASSHTFMGFVIYAIIAGFGDSFVSGAKDALMYDSLKESGKESEYAKLSARASLYFQIGLALAIVLGGYLSLYGYVRAIYATITACTIQFVLSFFFIEPKIDTVKFSLLSYIKQIRNGWEEITKTAYIREISAFYIAVGGITWAAMMIFNTSLLTTIGYTTFQIGIILGIIRIVNGTVLFRALHLDTVVTKRRAYLFFPILMIISYLPGIFLSKELAVIAVAGSIFASSARWIILGAYVNEHYDSKNRATALSMLSMIIAFVVVIFALLTGPITTYLGGVRGVYTILGICSLSIVLPLGLRIRRRYH